MSEDLPFGSRGGVAIPYQFPVDGEYLVKIELWRQLYDYIIGMGEPHQLDIRLDGVLLKRFTVGGEGKGMTAPENFAGNTQGDPEWEKYMHTADAGLEVRTPVKAGPHIVGVSFVRRHWEPEGILQPPQTGFSRTTNEHYYGNPQGEDGFDRRTVQGAGPGRRHRRGEKVFICAPKDADGRGAVREEDSVDSRDARVSASARLTVKCRCFSIFTRRAGARRPSMRESSAASNEFSRRRASCSALLRPPTSRSPAQPDRHLSSQRSRSRVASVISSCGAAFQTRSCSTRR